MNQFLTILSNAIMDTNGTIDKFMGDAVMAFWNAPLDTPDHERAACQAALRMIKDVEELNAMRLLAGQGSKKRKRSKDRSRTKLPVGKSGKVHRINVGIGINTGQCVVGNMGSQTRFDYTALGDPVNVASRLEGQSRFYGAAIILGQETARRVKGDFALFELDMVRVVGKALPENIFALVGDRAMATNSAFRAAAEINASMLTAYRAQDWDTAEMRLKELSAALKSTDLKFKKYIKIYDERITDLRSSELGEDWDGVFAFTKK
jgi:adenylate cyclase